MPRAGSPTAGQGYELLDSGGGRKLEQVGPYRLVRQAPQAAWKPGLPESEWAKADAVYVRSSEGGGRWRFQARIEREFDLDFAGFRLHLKLTDFGHLGLFPEQAEQWAWLREVIGGRIATGPGATISVLNLFAYTGGSTLTAAAAGAQVVHVDAARGVVDWARQNARLSGLESAPVRWIVDDAVKFLAREARRGNRYQGLILDPPSFGRGPKGEVFKLEDEVVNLLDACAAVMAPDALFVLYSCHTPGFTPLVVANQLRGIVRGGSLESGEMTVPERSGRLLPAGVYARWRSK